MSNTQNPTLTSAPTAGNASSQKTPLLHAWHDPLANIKTNNSCVRLVDLNCDGDAKLCVCDYDKKMRVYKGTNLVVEYAILDVPTAMCITYMEASLVLNHFDT
jgi:Bardet-Biedl syndrome 1 protein